MSRTPDGERSDVDVRPLRVVRAVLLAAVTVACSAAAHTTAGGGLPDAAGVALLGAFTLVVTGVLARWRLTPWTLAPVLGALQVALHHGFQLFAPSRAVAPSAATQVARQVHHGGHGGVEHTVPNTTAQSDVLGHAAGHLDPVMIGAHLLAVGVITALAVGADRALERTVRRFRAVVVVLLRGVTPVRAPERPVVPVGHVVLAVLRRSTGSRSRRGPPARPRTA